MTIKIKFKKKKFLSPFKTALSKMVKEIKGRALCSQCITIHTSPLAHVRDIANRFMYAGLNTELTCFPGDLCHVY